MLKAIHAKLTYANVMATVAVFVALGGGAYAMSRIGTNDLASDAKARALDFNRAAGLEVLNPGDPVPLHGVLKLDELTVKGECYELFGVRTVGLAVATSANADVNYTYVENNDAVNNSLSTHASGFSLAAGTNHEVLEGGNAPGGGTLRFEGQLVYHNSQRVITVTFHAVSNPETARCQITGTAINGT